MINLRYITISWDSVLTYSKESIIFLASLAGLLSALEGDAIAAPIWLCVAGIWIIILNIENK